MKINIIFFYLLIIYTSIIYSSGCKKKDPDCETCPCPSCPTVDSISPKSEHGGATINIYGKNFVADVAGNTVKINGIALTDITSATSTQIVGTIPQGCGTGPVTVDVNTILTHFGTSPTFTYMYITDVTRFAGDENNTTHNVTDIYSDLGFSLPWGIFSTNNALYVIDNSHVTRIDYIDSLCDDRYLNTNYMGSSSGSNYYYETQYDFNTNQLNIIDNSTLHEFLKCPYYGNIDSLQNIYYYDRMLLTKDNSELIYSFRRKNINGNEQYYFCKSSSPDDCEGTLYATNLIVSKIKYYNGFLYTLGNNKICKLSTSDFAVLDSFDVTTSSIFFGPQGITDFCLSGETLYFISVEKQRLFKFISNREVVAIAGSGVTGYSGTDFEFFQQFENHSSITDGPNGKLFISNTGKSRIEMVSFH